MLAKETASKKAVPTKVNLLIILWNSGLLLKIELTKQLQPVCNQGQITIIVFFTGFAFIFG